ncbi:MAG: hypothetical protein HYX72_09130 [Acidobacteria bacterium]|nr:hypothetical protein [Acidobacteriota bacterium]
MSPNNHSRQLVAATLLVVFFTPASTLRADTIILKNGRRIVAEAVSVEDDKVFYESEGGRVSLPKSLVETIEKDDKVLTPSSPAARQQAPAPKPRGEAFKKALAVEIQVPQKDAEGVIRDNAVDEDRLNAVASLADKGDLERQNAVNAYLVAAVFEARKQRAAQASHWAEEALRISGRDPNALILAAHLDIVRQQYTEALNHLFLAQSLGPDAPDVLVLLGYAYYFIEGPEKANRYWKRANSLHPDPRLQELIAETDQEEQIEGKFTQAQSNHFILSREGSEISESFSRQILETLEQHYRDLEAALDFSPREPLTVILYPAQQFADVTRSPSWVGALNDGKVRVPVQGLSSMTTELSRVLKHEMVHSFVHRQVQGRCPTWFNEGLAQVESGEDPAVPPATLAKLYASSRHIPLERLESSFMQFDSITAAVAYAESQAAVAMIRDKEGAYQLTEMLKSLAAGRSMTETLRRLFRTSYEEMDENVGAYLRR